MLALEQHACNRSLRDVQRVEDVERRRLCAGVVHDLQNPSLVFLCRSRTWRKDRFLHKTPFAIVPNLLLRRRLAVRVRGMFHQALIRAPLDVILDDGSRAVSVRVFTTNKLVVHRRKFPNTIVQYRLLARLTHWIDNESRVLDSGTTVEKRRIHRVEIHRKIHKDPRQGVQDDVAVLALECVDVVKEELRFELDGLLSNLTRLLRARQAVQNCALSIHHANRLRQRALGKHVLGEKLLRVQTRGILEQKVPVLRDEAIVKESKSGVRDVKVIHSRRLALGVPLVKRGAVDVLRKRRLAFDAKADQAFLFLGCTFPNSVVRGHLRHTKLRAENFINLADSLQILRAHLVRFATFPQRVRLAAPVDDASVSHVLNIEIERVVKRITLGVTNRESALVNHLLRRLLFGESLCADKIVPEFHVAILKRRRVHQPIAIEELIQLLPVNLQQPRSIAKQRPFQLFRDLPDDRRLRFALARDAQRRVAIHRAPIFNRLIRRRPRPIRRCVPGLVRRARKIPVLRFHRRRRVALSRRRVHARLFVRRRGRHRASRRRRRRDAARASSRRRRGRARGRDHRRRRHRPRRRRRARPRGEL